MQEIKVSESEAKGRFDVVTSQLTGVSRSQAQKRIKRGEITLNGEVVTPHQTVELNDVIQVPDDFAAPEREKGAIPELNILYEDDDVLVINKQAGLIVHPATGLEPATLVDALLEHVPNIETVGDDPKRPGIVHRLDKGASGVLVIAKTQRAFEFLKTQFMNRTVEKEYLALVYGQVSKDTDTIRLKLTRSKAKGKMIARPEDAEGKEAITHYDVIERYKTATYVRVRIETGRTHQIRAHFRALDHPIVGDELYKKRQMTHIRRLDLGRLFLHAHVLTLTLPNGERQSFTAPLPDELEALLTLLPKQ